MQLLEVRKPDRARAKVNYLLRTGKLNRPLVCTKCGKSGDIRAHHENYDKPLEVVWLCNSCHSKLKTPNHKIPERGNGGNRAKTDRDNKIYDLYTKGYRYKSIVNIFKMKTSAVGMVIWRRKKELK